MIGVEIDIYLRMMMKLILLGKMKQLASGIDKAFQDQTKVFRNQLENGLQRYSKVDSG